MKIEGSVILVTGGASGIGRSMALLFNEKSAIVYICDIQEDLGLEVQKTSNNKIKFIKCDLTNEEEIIAMIEQIIKENGRIDVLINNAGITGIPERNSTDLDILWQNHLKVFEVNVTSGFLVTKYAAKYMINKSDPKNDCNGNIILLSSIFGHEGSSGFTTYAGSKTAFLGMTLPLARELGKYRIRVNSICPGSILTPLIESIIGTVSHQKQLKQCPLERDGLPIEIAYAAEAIIKNDFINGTNIRVDGGLIFPKL